MLGDEGLVIFLFYRFVPCCPKLPGVLTGEEQNEKHLIGTIMQLKSEQLEISVQVSMVLSLFDS